MTLPHTSEFLESNMWEASKSVSFVLILREILFICLFVLLFIYLFIKWRIAA